MWIVDNSVIATYNRHSGQFEIIWERHSHGSGLSDTLSVAKSQKEWMNTSEESEASANDIQPQF